MSEIIIPLFPDKIYHIYNHAVGKDLLFESEADYNYFMSKFAQYIVPVCEVFAYCLMPNHFHFALRTKDDDVLKVYYNKLKVKQPDVIRKLATEIDYTSILLSRSFSNFFNTYAKHCNVIRNRMGTLFKRAFRRKEIDDMIYFRTLLRYIHQNPVQAGLTDSLAVWKYSSYKDLTGKSETFLQRNYVLEVFDDLNNFKHCMEIRVDLDFDY